jgi:hypothetical protein
MIFILGPNKRTAEFYAREKRLLHYKVICGVGDLRGCTKVILVCLPGYHMREDIDEINAEIESMENMGDLVKSV